MVHGYSIPFCGLQRDGQKILLLFTSLKKANKYVDKSGYKKPGGNYLVGKIENRDGKNELIDICRKLRQLGVYGINVDIASDDLFGCTLEYLFDVNGIDYSNDTVFQSEEEYRKQYGIQTPYPIDPIAIIDFKNPYLLTAERSEELMKNVFSAGNNLPQANETFRRKETLNENVITSDILNSRILPRAKAENREQDVKYFQIINSLLERVTWERLADERDLYTLYTKDDELLVVNDCMYVFYTDMYENVQRAKLTKISGRPDIRKLAREHNIKGIIVTDGTSKILFLQERTFKDN